MSDVKCHRSNVLFFTSFTRVIQSEDIEHPLTSKNREGGLSWDTSKEERSEIETRGYFNTLVKET